MMHRMDSEEFHGWMAYYDILADEEDKRKAELDAKQAELEAKINQGR